MDDLGDFMNMKTKLTKVLCYSCGKPIKSEDLGAVVSVGGKMKWFHEWLPCLNKIKETKTNPPVSEKKVSHAPDCNQWECKCGAEEFNKPVSEGLEELKLQAAWELWLEASLGLSEEKSGMISKKIIEELTTREAEIRKQEREMRLYGRDKDVYPENFMGVTELKEKVRKEERERLAESVEKLKIKCELCGEVKSTRTHLDFPDHGISETKCNQILDQVLKIIRGEEV